MKKRIFQIVLAIPVAGIGLLCSAQDSSSVPPRPVCAPESFPELPDVAIASVTEESDPATHCKVAGKIGTETNFELLLPDNWNGKFVMGGGGGFVGVVMNFALWYGPV